jgi:putative transposase
MVAFIDEHKAVYGVEPIAAVLPIAPSTYRKHVAERRDPQRRCQRARDDVLNRGHVRRVWQANHGVYGADKVWRQLHREGVPIARCTVERLMRQMGLAGAVRGRSWTTTTRCDARAGRPGDLVERDFTAQRPNQLWVSDLTYVATWQGFVYVAFVVDAFARRIVGWRATTHLRTELAMDALDQAIAERLGTRRAQDLTHHSDAGSQYLAVRYTERLGQAGIEPSVGSVGDSFDNALAETIIGLFKTEVIRRQGPWRGIDDVEMATLTWVHWFNHQRLYGPIGNIPPAEHEDRYYAQFGQLELALPNP